MRRLLFAPVIAALGWIGPALGMATSMPGLNGSNINATQVEKVGYFGHVRVWNKQTGYGVAKASMGNHSTTLYGLMTTLCEPPIRTHCFGRSTSCLPSCSPP